MTSSGHPRCFGSMPKTNNLASSSRDCTSRPGRYLASWLHAIIFDSAHGRQGPDEEWQDSPTGKGCQ
eukprot:7580923-Alexandrium_andersonii.AAC.1